jgi:hypothetical protein
MEIEASKGHIIQTVTFCNLRFFIPFFSIFEFMNSVQNSIDGKVNENELLKSEIDENGIEYGESY